MTSYPIMLNLIDKTVVIVGGGKIASRKISNLISSGAVVTVISPTITHSLHSLAEQEKIRWLAQPYQFDVLEQTKPMLVFATTNSDEVNQQIATDSHKIGAWVNVVSDSEKSDFHNMAVIEQSPLTIGISTNGTSPALLKMMKSKIEAILGDNIQILATWIGEIRSEISSEIPLQSNRQALYERIIQSDVLDLLQSGDVEAAKARFDALIAEGIA